MKTIEDIPADLRPCFDLLLSKGWKQIAVNSGDYVLGSVNNRHEAHLFHFPEDHIAIVNKAGTDCLIACKTVSFLDGHINLLRNT